MSKRDLRKYLHGLEKEHLEDQIILLYEKFPNVKKYYDFVFNPQEEKLIGEAKTKILNEYFPRKTKRARMRRSIARDFIKHFITLGVDPYLIADLMLFHIETAQKYAAGKTIRFESFYKGIFLAFRQAVVYIGENSLNAEFASRLKFVSDAAASQRWPNRHDFNDLLLHN